MFGLPGDPPVAIRCRRPLRLDGLHTSRVQARRGDQGVPVDVSRRRRSVLDLRRHGVHLQEAAAGVEPHARHPRLQGRGLVLRHPPAEAERAHRARALPVPELERGPADDERPRRLLGALRFDVRQVVDVDFQAPRLVGRLLLVACPVQDLLRALLERGRRLERHVAEDRPPRPHGEGQADGRHQPSEAGPGHQRSQTPLLSRRRHHLRRRSLAGGEGRGQRVAAGQRRSHRAGRSGTPARLLLEAAQDDALDRRVHVGDEARRRRRRRLLVLPRQLGERAPLERLLAGEHLVQDEAERIDVAARRDGRAGELLGRHVRRGAGADLRALEIGGEPGQAEVGDAHVAAAVDHHVFGLQVAVQHAAVVCGGEARAQLAGYLDRLVGRQAADAPQQGREVFAVHELHGQEVVAVDLVDVVDATHVRMRDLPRRRHLA